MQTYVIPSDGQIKEIARSQAREVLAGSEVFKGMSLQDQQSIYRTLVEENIEKQRAKHGLARPFATDSGKEMGYKGYDPGFQGDTAAFNELVNSVDFTKFCTGLLKGVFDANCVVMKQQTDIYIKLCKEATKSSAEFIKNVKDDESFARLAESRSDQYNVTTEKNADGSMKLALTNPSGEKLDTEDSEVKRHILEAKINMAKEHRAALREVLLMGVTRLIVRKGEVEAGVEFSVKAQRDSRAHHSDQNVNVTSANFEHEPPLFGLFGGPGGSISTTNTNIQVNTSDKKATDDLSATLKGRVKIEFATDYFKLDNFAQMYADGGIAALKEGTAGGASGAAGGKGGN